VIPFDRSRYTGEGRQVVRYYLFSQEEADERDINYVQWRKAKPEKPFHNKVPDYDDQKVDRSRTYLIDDHGVVSPIFDGVYLVNERTSQVQVIFVFGRRYSSRKTFGYGHENMTCNYSWDEKESRRERTRRVVVAYTRILLERSRLNDNDWLRLGTMWRDDQDQPISSIKRIFRTKAVKEMVRSELALLMTNAKITPEEVLKHYEAVREKARDKDDLATELRVLDKYTDMLDMKPDKIEISGGILETRDLSHLLKPRSIDTDFEYQSSIGDSIPDVHGLLEENDN
tara:strand:+ start:76 stop:930 length:855 start_codon:yes stop_codon:yes gene_type:complete